MADKFLNTGGSGNSNISNGTATIFGATIGADNLDASKPIKTNSTKQLISTNLDIADINSLQNELEVRPNLTLIKNDTQTNPATNGIKVYAKLDGNLYKRDSTGVESGFAGASDFQQLYDGSTPALITTATTKPLVLQTGSADTDVLIACSDLVGTKNFSVKADGEMITKKIKSTTGNIELDLNDNIFNLTSSGNNVFTSTGYTQIAAGTTIDIEAVSVLINDNNIITSLGGDNLLTTLTTTQTSFTNNQELITKKYVDDNNTNDPKTQNISATDTNSAQTLFERNVIFGTDPMEILDRNSIDALQTSTAITSPETQGFSFTIPTPIIIKSVLFYATHWGSTDTTKEWKLWRDEGRELLKTTTIDKLNQVGDYYRTDLATPFILSAGNYRCGLILNNGDKKHNYSTATDFFDPFFTVASGVYTGIPDPAPTLEYPSGGSNNPASAILFDILNDFDNKGTTNLEQETKIQSAKIGYNFDNYYINGVGDGNVLYGNPTETGTVSYIGDYVNLGGGGFPAGKLEYSMLNLYQAGKKLQFDIKFSFAPWSADGPFINWDFGDYRFQYNNNETTGNSSFEISANSVLIHSTTASIPYTSDYTELTLSLIFDVDTQTFTCFSNGTSFFTFIDTTPRTPNTTQKNRWVIQGGGQNGASNVTRIYSMKVYNPSSTTALVEITPTTARCNSTFSTQSMTCDSKIECPDFRVSTTLGGIRGYADQSIVFDEVNNELEIRSEATSVGKIKLVATDRTEIDTILDIAGSGSIQRPFTVLNPTYNNSLQVERQALGMGLLWKDNDITQSYISSQGQILNVVAGSNLNIETGTTGKVIGLPFDLIFVVTDEISTITTTGQKISLRVPQDFTASKIKISVNTAGGTGFQVLIKKNGTTTETITQGNLLISNTLSIEPYIEDDIITCEVNNVGSGTAIGLKIYLIGKTT